nr:MAG TPA: hypothetical protein [Caudoviricetes sp.]
MHHVTIKIMVSVDELMQKVVRVISNYSTYKIYSLNGYI